MQIVKLDAIDSTNAYLKRMSVSNTLGDFTVVTAKEQWSGRGQMGTTWQSEPGKNLTFSVFKKINSLPVVRQFDLSMTVSLAVFHALKDIGVPDLHIKWPNDIMSGNFKICGILVQNILSGPKIKTTIIGIGLNVNQTNFVNVLNASSLKLLLGRSIDLDELLLALLEQLKVSFKVFDEIAGRTLKKRYEEHLFRKDKPATFEIEKEQKMGFIRGVTDEGHLLVEHEDAQFTSYGLKEIKLLY